MDFEQVFAAEVFSSATQATILQQRGIGSSASDFVEVALMALWQMAPLQAQVIADRYVFWDSNGKTWARPVRLGTWCPCDDCCSNTCSTSFLTKTTSISANTIY